MTDHRWSRTQETIAWVLCRTTSTGQWCRIANWFVILGEAIDPGMEHERHVCPECNAEWEGGSRL